MQVVGRVLVPVDDGLETIPDALASRPAAEEVAAVAGGGRRAAGGAMASAFQIWRASSTCLRGEGAGRDQ